MVHGCINNDFCFTLKFISDEKKMILWFFLFISFSNDVLHFLFLFFVQQIKIDDLFENFVHDKSFVGSVSASRRRR